MLSTTINKEITNLINALDEAEYLNRVLKDYNKLFLNINSNLEGFEDDYKLSRVIEEFDSFGLFTKKLSEIKETNKIKPRQLFVSIDKLQTVMSEAAKYFKNNKDLLFIEQSLESFSEVYDFFIEQPCTHSSWALVVEASSLYMLLNGFKSGLNLYNKNIESSDLDFEDGSELLLMLSSSMTLTVFIEKLHSVNKLYIEICMLSGISNKEYPLQIVKIESGSMWAKLFGNSKVIALLTKFIESGAGYVYRKYTNEGKLINIPKKVETVESILNLNSRLEKEGIDTKDLKEHISKSAVIIAKELNVLLSGQPEIVINHKKISIGSEVQKKLIESNETLRLEQDKNE